MKKTTKIYVSVMVLLVMLTNISYSMTYSICGMSSMSHCSCDIGNIDNHSSFKNVSCCKEEVKSISNNAEFTKIKEQPYKSDYTNSVYVLTGTAILSNSLIRKETIVFHVPKGDMPVLFSRLLI